MMAVLRQKGSDEVVDGWTEVSCADVLTEAVVGEVLHQLHEAWLRGHLVHGECFDLLDPAASLDAFESGRERVDVVEDVEGLVLEADRLAHGREHPGLWKAQCAIHIEDDSLDGGKSVTGTHNGVFDGWLCGDVVCRRKDRGRGAGTIYGIVDRQRYRKARLTVDSGWR